MAEELTWEQPALPPFSYLEGISNFVGGNAAEEISTCHEQMRFIREHCLKFFALVGG